MRRISFLALVFVLTAWLATLGGCKAKASLDADVDHLLTAIATADYEHFKLDADPGLVKEVSKQEFDEGSVTVKKLGALKSKSMKGLETKTTNGVTVSSGNYDLVFANGKCKLQIKSHEGKLFAFHFSNIEMGAK